MFVRACARLCIFEYIANTYLCWALGDAVAAEKSRRKAYRPLFGFQETATAHVIHNTRLHRPDDSITKFSSPVVSASQPIVRLLVCVIGQWSVLTIREPQFNLYNAKQRRLKTKLYLFIKTSLNYRQDSNLKFVDLLILCSDVFLCFISHIG